MDIEQELLKYPKFSNVPTVQTAAGEDIRFLLTDLDTEYLVAPVGFDNIPDGMIPPEDYLIGILFEQCLVAEVLVRSLGFWHKLFKTKLYKEALQSLVENTNQMKAVVTFNAKTRAAAIRVAKLAKSASQIK